MLDRGETRLKDHLLEHPHTARTVQLIFIQISNLFADVKQLRKLYKIEINAGSKNVSILYSSYPFVMRSINFYVLFLYMF